MAIGTLQTRFTDPRPEDPPLPLPEPEDPDELLTAEDLRAQSGPQLTEVARCLLNALASCDQITSAEVFNVADVSLRRPTELLGYIHLAAITGSENLENDADRENAHAIRPDGSLVTYDIPKITFDLDDMDQLTTLLLEEDRR